MEFYDFIDLFSNSLFWRPAKWIWDTIHSIPIFVSVTAEIWSVILIMFFYSVVLYLIWCFLAGILDILTYNKRKTLELASDANAKKESQENYNNWKQQIISNEAKEPMRLEPNSDLYKHFVETIAKDSGMSKKEIKKIMKKK